MTAVAIAAAILLGIVILVVVWYNGKNYGQKKTEAETIQVGAEVVAEHAKQLEDARAKDNEAARQKDLDEAKHVTDGDGAADFFLRSRKRSQGPGSN